MRSRCRALALTASVLTAGGFLFAGPGTGCASYMAETALVTTDFCFVFDCQNGIFAGTIDPCTGQGSGNQTFEAQGQLPLFTDCPTGATNP